MTFFCSQELAARIEAAEAGMIAGAADVALRRVPDGGYFVAKVGGGVAAWCGANSPFDKVAGWGFAELTDQALDALEAAYRERGSGLRVELATLGDPAIAERLTRRGYVLKGYENVLGLRLPVAEGPPPSEVDVEVATIEQSAAWLDVVVTGFATPDTQGIPSEEDFPRDILENTINDMVGAAGVFRYLARWGGELAGGASLRIAGGLAQLAGAATLPACRRRGVQSALLAARLDDAAKAGCDLAVVTTQPGSKSMENAQKRGFQLLYARAVLELPAAP